MADPCVQLAQRLAANERRHRERALRRLRAYLQQRSGRPGGGFGADEFSKIWKGLFYCMWMQDKPLLQEELALNMAKLVHSLQSRESRNLFIRAFWQALSREWNGIDRLRLDKFYTLTRFVLHQSVQLLKEAEWEESMVAEFLSILVEEVLKAEAPRGVQHHLIDIYLDELAKIGSQELTAAMNLRLIEPFCKMAAKTKDPLLQQSVVNGIFQMILDQAPFAIEELMKELGQTPADDEMADDGGTRGPQIQDTEDIGPVLQFDYSAISERLFALASRQNIPARNRKSLYRLVKRFKDLAEGVFPHDDFPEEVSTDEDDDEYSSWRFRQRQKKFQEKLLASQGIAVEAEKRGKRRRAAPETEDSSGKPEVPPAKVKRKKGSVNVEHPVLNGRAESPPTEKTGNSRGTSQTPPTADVSHHCDAPLAKIHMKRRKRSCLLRMGLSVLPLRGASLLRRRRLIARRRQVASIKPSAASPTPQTPSGKPPLKTRTTQAASPTALTPSGKPPLKTRATQAASPTALTPSGKPPLKTKATTQEFVTFQKSEAPKPLYVKSSKTRGRQINKKLICRSKKVTFSLNKNMTAEFKRTDRSLLVSPDGSSRVPFNPDQQPTHGVLKSPANSPRPRASDFF